MGKCPYGGLCGLRLMEFIEGAARLKGSAKALDIWRLETKVEADTCRGQRFFFLSIPKNPKGFICKHRGFTRTSLAYDP